jgi:hypothetical protein
MNSSRREGRSVRAEHGRAQRRGVALEVAPRALKSGLVRVELWAHLNIPVEREKSKTHLELAQVIATRDVTGSRRPESRAMPSRSRR